MASKNKEPIEKLHELLMQADYYLAYRLSQSTDNSYQRFLLHFSQSHFRTFNYDSLLEIILFQLRRWRPEDGYGVPVQAHLHSNQSNLPSASTNLVLHLHGSLYVYTSEYQIRWTGSHRAHFGMIERRKEPLFAFDADSIGSLFPYAPVLPTEWLYRLDERVIAPIPNKAPRLQDSFVGSVYQRARQLISRAEQLVSIGYRFSPHDRESFTSLLQDFAVKPRASMILVSPDALEIKHRLKEDYPRLHVEAISFPFCTWVSKGFAGVE